MSRRVLPRWMQHVLGRDRAIEAMLKSGEIRATADGTIEIRRKDDGYSAARIYTNNQGSGRFQIHSHYYLVRRAVAIAFFGRRRVYRDVDTRNGNPLDTRPENLVYRTRSQNFVIEVLSGRKPRPPSAKLDMAKATEIRRKRRLGATYRQLAAEYGVHETTVEEVVKYRSWMPKGRRRRFD